MALGFYMGGTVNTVAKKMESLKLVSTSSDTYTAAESGAYIICAKATTNKSSTTTKSEITTNGSVLAKKYTYHQSSTCGVSDSYVGGWTTTCVVVANLNVGQTISISVNGSTYNNCMILYAGKKFKMVNYVGGGVVIDSSTSRTSLSNGNSIMFVYGSNSVSGANYSSSSQDNLKQSTGGISIVATKTVGNTCYGSASNNNFGCCGVLEFTYTY